MTEINHPGGQILLVEDEESLAIGLEYNLTEEGYRVVRAEDGRQALKAFKSEHFDLIILDLMLPYLDGFEVAEAVRKQSPQIPILILTARTAAKDKVRGLELGADDYLTKPFYLQELLARVKGMLRRKKWYKEVTNEHPNYNIGNIRVNFETLTLRSGNQETTLTQREAMVLRFLIDNKNRVVSRKELLEKVWATSSEVETRTIDNFIMRLRKYIEPNPSKPIYIKSVRSVGYIFTDDDKRKAV